MTGVRLSAEITKGMAAHKALSGIPIGTQVEFAMREWLDRQTGVVPGYTQDKLWQSVRHLVGEGSIRERCGAIVQDLVMISGPHRQAFPNHPDLQRDFDAVLVKLSAMKQEPLSESALDELAGSILSLFAEATLLTRSVPTGASHFVRPRR